MNCEEFRSAVLSGHEDNATAAHESGCGSCHLQASDLRDASVALSRSVVWEEPSPELEGQVTALIGVAAGAKSPDQRASRVNRKWIAAAAVAACAIAFVGLFALNNGATPDWEVALPATELAPDASGVVRGWNEQSGTRMVVAIEGLEPAPEGFIYEFWLSSGPVHISAGTFHSGGEIELWSGVSRADYPRLWITLEAVDEDESPSRKTVLDTGRANA